MRRERRGMKGKLPSLVELQPGNLRAEVGVDSGSWRAIPGSETSSTVEFRATPVSETPSTGFRRFDILQEDVMLLLTSYWV